MSNLVGKLPRLAFLATGFAFVVGVFVFGFLGRIIDRKGINELIEAFLKIYDEG